MRPMTAAMLAVAGAHLALAAPARAQGEGFLCGFAAVTDPTSPEGVHTGEVEGGPITATSTDPSAPSANPNASLTLRCVIQVGPAGQFYTGTDAASASSIGTGVVVLPPTQVFYLYPEGLDVWSCTELRRDDDGPGGSPATQYYYDYLNDAWSTSNSVECSLAISQGISTRSTCAVFGSTVCMDTDLAPPPWYCDMAGCS